MRTLPTIFIVPTGIGCEIGGFAGDAIPAAKLLAASTGCLITHPNVMNGGSLSTVDEKIFYVEGYSLDKFARGEIGLKKVNQQRIGIIFDSGISNEMFHRHLQVADACTATLGINLETYVRTDKPLGVVFEDQASGASGGYIENPDTLIEAGQKLLNQGITAIAIVSDFPDELENKDITLYREGKSVDKISGVEAVISHLISKFLKVPCAHAPALSPLNVKEDLDPRAAAEEIGFTFLPSVLMGLNKAPNLVDLPSSDREITLLPNEVRSIVVPSGALGGEAVLACIERGIPVIAVKNKSILKVDSGKINYSNIIDVNNYFEAAGVLLSLREGIALKSLQRPIKSFKNFQII